MATKKHKEYFISDELYNTIYYIGIGTEKQANEAFRKLFKVKAKDFSIGRENSNFHVFVADINPVNFIWFNGIDFENHLSSSVEIIQHELHHAVFETFDYAGVKISLDNHEHFNYYFSYIFNKIFKILSKDN